MQIQVSDCDLMEKAIIKVFKDTFKHRKYIGNEYFEGDVKTQFLSPTGNNCNV